jgi:hypothetical protein
MDIKRKRSFSAAVGGSALIALIALGTAYASSPSGVHNAESGDSATGTTYTPPSVPAMSISATGMSTGVTTTPAAPLTAAATAKASPTLSTTVAAPCADKGVVLPGGCH